MCTLGWDLGKDLGKDLGRNHALFSIHELLRSYFGNIESHYKNTIGCLYSRCFVFTDSFRFLLWLFPRFFPRSHPRSPQDRVIYLLYYILYLFYTSIVKVYTHCLFSAETSAKTLERTLRCSVFMIVYGLILEISRVNTNIPFIKIQIDIWLSMYSVYVLRWLVFFVLLMVFFQKYRESLQTPSIYPFFHN